MEHTGFNLEIAEWRLKLMCIQILCSIISALVIHARIVLVKFKRVPSFWTTATKSGQNPNRTYSQTRPQGTTWQTQKQESLGPVNMQHSIYTTNIAGNFRPGIHTSNSMDSSEIWDKYHECCIGKWIKFHRAKPSEISIFNATRVAYINYSQHAHQLHALWGIVGQLIYHCLWEVCPSSKSTPTG